MSGPRLGIDAHRLLGARTGVARYLQALLREWSAMELPFGEVVVYSPAPLPEEVLPEAHPYTVRIVPARGPDGVWVHWHLGRAAREVDVLFCPSYVAPLVYRGRVVVTIHDAARENVAESFPLRTRYRRSLYRHTARRADVVLTDSVSAKRDLERAHGLDPSRVWVVPVGVDSASLACSAAEEEAVRRRYGLEERRIVLFVGKFSRRRNVPLLVRAFAAGLNGAAGSWALVLVGANPLGLPLQELGEELELGDSLKVPGFVPDADLRALYRAAEIFAQPSDYEGTSLTVLEAMAAGTAVITGDHSGLREVAGDAGLLLRPITEDHLAGALARLMSNEELRREYVSKGLARAASFTWREAAARTAEALVSSVNGTAGR